MPNRPITMTYLVVHVHVLKIWGTCKYAWYRILAIPMAPCKKLDNLEVFNNDKSLGFCLRKQRQAKIKFCMHVVDIRHQECLGSIVIVWLTCTLWKVYCDCVVPKALSCQSIQPSYVFTWHSSNCFTHLLKARNAFFSTWINKVSLESTKCHLNQQSVKLLIEQSQFACVSKCWPSWITQQTSRITGHIIFRPLALNLSPLLQVRKLCEYSNPEIAFEYSYEMRIFEHSNIRWHP